MERQRCQPSFGPVSRVLEPDSPLADSMFHDIAGKGPRQIEIAAHVAYEFVTNVGVNISHVGLRM